MAAADKAPITDAGSAAPPPARRPGASLHGPRVRRGGVGDETTVEDDRRRSRAARSADCRAPARPSNRGPGIAGIGYLPPGTRVTRLTMRLTQPLVSCSMQRTSCVLRASARRLSRSTRLALGSEMP